MKLKEEDWTTFDLQKKARQIGQEKFYEVHLKKVKDETDLELIDARNSDFRKNSDDHLTKNEQILNLTALLLDDCTSAPKFQQKLFDDVDWKV